jgi:hypothetical protein
VVLHVGNFLAVLFGQSATRKSLSLTLAHAYVLINCAKSENRRILSVGQAEPPYAP